MMRLDSFARGAAFAAAAAAAWIPWALCAGAIVGRAPALALYLARATALFAAGIAPRGTRRGAVALAVGGLALTLALLARSATELGLGLAVLLGVVRGAYLYRGAPSRTLLREAALLLGGLLLARFVGGPSPLATAFALWAFLLVQSCFFLLRGGRATTPTRGAIDPFEAAQRRAMELIESRPP